MCSDSTFHNQEVWVTVRLLMDGELQQEHKHNESSVLYTKFISFLTWYLLDELKGISQTLG